MLVSDFDYHLPKELIAQKSIKPRDNSRLLVVDRAGKKIQHKHFFDLPKFLKKGDLLVFNDTKVFKARLFGTIIPHCHSEGEARRIFCKNQEILRSCLSGTCLPVGMGQVAQDDKTIEIFLLRPIGQYEWKILGRPGKKLALGAMVAINKKLNCVVQEKKDDVLIVKFNQPVKKVLSYAARAGHVPVPPYIEEEPAALADYQTIYAKHTGSVAAPTAGFHFTPRLFKELKKIGVETAFVTLHVGLGTFRPVKTEKVEEHKMHSEWAEIGARTAAAINRAKQEGRRVIAVGTTTARTLEGVASLSLRGAEGDEAIPSQARLPRHADAWLAMTIKSYSGDIDIFITPGFQFKVIDGLITNFHLPKSTLIMLVSAFIGNREWTLRIYQKAVKLKYRFFSFGDAMLII